MIVDCIGSNEKVIKEWVSKHNFLMSEKIIAVLLFISADIEDLNAYDISESLLTNLITVKDHFFIRSYRVLDEQEAKSAVYNYQSEFENTCTVQITPDFLSNYITVNWGDFWKDADFGQLEDVLDGFYRVIVDCQNYYILPRNG
jgi:hypothetical protein